MRPACAAIGSNTQERGLYCAARLYESDTPSSNIIDVVMFRGALSRWTCCSNLRYAQLPVIAITANAIMANAGDGIASAALRPA